MLDQGGGNRNHSCWVAMSFETKAGRPITGAFNTSVGGCGVTILTDEEFARFRAANSTEGVVLHGKGSQLAKAGSTHNFSLWEARTDGKYWLFLDYSSTKTNEVKAWLWEMPAFAAGEFTFK